ARKKTGSDSGRLAAAASAIVPCPLTHQAVAAPSMQVIRTLAASMYLRMKVGLKDGQYLKHFFARFPHYPTVPAVGWKALPFVQRVLCRPLARMSGQRSKGAGAKDRPPNIVGWAGALMPPW